ncbi:hypothetical protein H6P81_007324 [Aristolochia fimbriata]|uniref:AAA+ ATPase domain-containing protein n=1 Tax=Aristolochia fimbriata TaxID=158543 RepID=A0AAV7F230_ARIFI|nr:hypothetical protein H6P81_007324 [Aristolochia fimbriata]
MAKLRAVGLVSAMASAALAADRAYADGPFKFFPFSTSPSSPDPAQTSPVPGQPFPLPNQSTQPTQASPQAPQEEKKPRNDNPFPRTSAAGFDPEALERGVVALREINKAPNSSKAFDVMREQEKTRQAEMAAREKEFKALEAQHQTERQRVMYEEQKKLNQQQAQIKAQMARYEDELARKRMEHEHESQRARNQELVKMQEESNSRLEQARRATEEHIQAQRRKTEEQKAEIERETIRVRSIAEAEGRAHEAKLAEDVNKRMLAERLKGEKEKLIEAINTTFEHIRDGFQALTNPDTLLMAVGGVTALAAGIYLTREGAKVYWAYIDRKLGQPSLIRESSRGKYPWSGLFSRGMTNAFRKSGEGAGSGKNGGMFGEVVLHPSLQKRIQQLAGATANTRSHGAQFRNMLFYGPPGTGKTMAAKELARKSGLDYALMTGGDVVPLGPQAVTKIHELFGWAEKSKKGLLLFIDEADAFLCERNKTYMSEAQRSALNALLAHTGDQSKNVVIALATNRPGDLDSAVIDRVDEYLEFPLPGEDERFKLLKLYLDKYIAQVGENKSGWLPFFRKDQQKIEIKGLSDDVIREAAAKTEGFSGREIAKLMASVQAAVYGSKDAFLDANMFREVVDFKVAEHQQRQKFAEGKSA